MIVATQRRHRDKHAPDRRSTKVRTSRTHQRPALAAAQWLRSGRFTTLLFLVPLLVCFGVFSWWPILRALVMTFQRTNLISPPTWVGAENLQRVLADPLLSTAVWNTVQYVGLSVLIGFPVPILMAVVIGELRRSRALASALVYLPVIIPPVVAVLLWKLFYAPGESGLFNTIAAWVGAGPFAWLNDAAMVIPAIVVQLTWANFGTATVIYLAALMSINTELYEAAEVDGAHPLRRLWHVTLPQMRPVMLIMLLLQLIGVFQLFTEPYIMTGGGPANRSVTILMLVYRYAFVQGDYGKATALSLLLAIALGLLSALYLGATRRWSTT
ncbi:sugar ABC transporter permease [Ruania alkalisoli]|uniref:Sugar ABC transporter permease n=1 Tax=Ruania alkalisoli TaxID=2779775 RepID=A0A7M1SYU3_9MICO|nr:sugar ABC transporter permease [Ruania alkalisoli]QOR71803.1 sugar ABC transporter permease [Ruania alkalisoli]